MIKLEDNCISSAMLGKISGSGSEADDRNTKTVIDTCPVE